MSFSTTACCRLVVPFMVEQGHKHHYMPLGSVPIHMEKISTQPATRLSLAKDMP